ncbi:MAG: tetratricopeptide repeat protein [Paracoccaceae bacterium]
MPIASLRPLAVLLLGGSLTLPALAETPVAPPPKPEPAAAAEVDGDPGAYLAARTAARDNDYSAGAAWFARALMADPDNLDLVQGAVVSNIGTGNFVAAAAAADRLVQMGEKDQIAYIALIADRAHKGDFPAVLGLLKGGQKVGALLDGLVNAWSELGAGRMSEALAGFDTLTSTPAIKAFGLYHKALALASAGDFEGAENIFSGKAAGPIAVTRRGIIAHAQVLSQLERDPEALEILDKAFGDDPEPALDALRARLKAGETVPFDIVRTPADGIAEVFYTLATALNGEADDGYTVLYARAATFLRPDHTEAVLLAAGLLDAQKQYDLATALYASVPADDPAFYIAEIGRAQGAYAMDRKEAALEILDALARKQPQNVTVQVALGDALRREEKWERALKAYDAALALPVANEERFWSVWYSRGIAEERLGNFPKAVSDMRKALELSPDEPQVLNYLGYSYVDRGENLDEALAMIQRAVSRKPDSGYIIDSLAWALYRLGRYDEALPHMEQASLLEPVDPVVTDHLGDVYWAVGRQMEARFQWRRALSFAPEEKDAARIRRKLEVGLDAVLAEEGAKPLVPVKSVEAKPADAD